MVLHYLILCLIHLYWSCIGRTWTWELSWDVLMLASSEELAAILALIASTWTLILELLTKNTGKILPHRFQENFRFKKNLEMRIVHFYPLWVFSHDLLDFHSKWHINCSDLSYLCLLPAQNLSQNRDCTFLPPGVGFFPWFAWFSLKTTHFWLRSKLFMPSTSSKFASK